MKIIQVFIINLLVFFPILAQQPAYFAGEWTFNKIKSEFSEGGDRFVPVKLKIAQGDSLLSVERTYQREYEDDFVDTLSFSLDGKENYSTFWNSPRVITASWSEDGQALTIDTKITFTRNDQQNEMISKDVWRLNPDGSELLREFSINGPMGQMNATYVFQK